MECNFESKPSVIFIAQIVVKWMFLNFPQKISQNSLEKLDTDGVALNTSEWDSPGWHITGSLSNKLLSDIDLTAFAY